VSAAIFIDKDGTLIDNVPHNVDPRRLVFAPHALDAARRFAESGFQLIVVSNQPGVAEGRFDHAALTRLMHVLASRMADAGAPLAGCFACTHAKAAGCSCRKPAPGLLQEAARVHGVDLAGSWMVGDILDDIEAGTRAGCRTVLLDVGNETEWKSSPLRVPTHRVAGWREAERAILGVPA